MNNAAIPSPFHYRTEAEATNRLRELEAAQDLFRYTVDGYSTWRLLRFAAASALQSLPVSAPPGNARWSRHFEQIVESVRDLPWLLFPHRARYVVKTFRSALSERACDRYRYIYFDDLLEAPGNYFKIETLNSPLYKGRRKFALLPMVRSNVSIELLTIFLSRVTDPANISQVARQIGACLRDESELGRLNVKRIASTLSSFYWAKRLYSWLLRRTYCQYVLSHTGEYALRTCWLALYPLVLWGIGFFDAGERTAIRNLLRFERSVA